MDALCSFNANAGINQYNYLCVLINLKKKLHFINLVFNFTKEC